MAGVTLQHIYKRYPNGYEAVKDLSLEIEDQAFVVFAGASGCGKHTTLRMIAGLEPITSGELWIGEELVNDVGARDRNIAMVFQNFALYPQVHVFDNIAFGLKLRKVAEREINKKVQAVAELLHLEEFLERKPGALSEGQKQRVAMARAIVCEPKVFLVEESLSQTDEKVHKQMRIDVARLHRELGFTVLYVTEKPAEEITFGTKIVVMEEGTLKEVRERS